MLCINGNWVEAETEKPQPFVCPVCQGQGHVVSGFYNPIRSNEGTFSTTVPTETCRSCWGSGVLRR